jgi:hypothetical protein
MAPNLSQLVQALTEDEKGILRDLMGIDVDTWTTTESGIKQFEKQLADHRKAVAESPPATAKELKEWERRSEKCVSCGVSGRAAELFVTLKDSTTVCVQCLEHLQKQVRLGKR